jgi:hypothetical protein
MARAIFFHVVLLCAAKAVLSQDCETVAGQEAYLRRETDSSCYTPLIRFRDNDELYPTGDEAKKICVEDCAGKVIKFLQSTDECRESIANQGGANYLQDNLCVFSDSEENKDKNCLQFLRGDLQNEPLGAALAACFTWYLGSADSECPSDTCSAALKTAVETYGCCYQNVFGTEDFISSSTQDSIDAFETDSSTQLPANFRLDPTNEELFKTCNVSLPDMCPTTITDSVPNLVVMPMTVLLFAMITKVIA